MGKYNSFEMIQNYDIAIIKILSYVPLSFFDHLRIQHAANHFVERKSLTSQEQTCPLYDPFTDDKNVSAAGKSCTRLMEGRAVYNSRSPTERK